MLHGRLSSEVQQLRAQLQAAGGDQTRSAAEQDELRSVNEQLQQQLKVSVSSILSPAIWSCIL